MSKLQSYVDFASGKNCIVCNSADNVTATAVSADGVTYIGPVCTVKTCRRDAHHNTGGVVTAAKDADKLMDNDFAPKNRE